MMVAAEQGDELNPLLLNILTALNSFSFCCVCYYYNCQLTAPLNALRASLPHHNRIGLVYIPADNAKLVIDDLVCRSFNLAFKKYEPVYLVQVNYRLEAKKPMVVASHPVILIDKLKLLFNGQQHFKISDVFVLSLSSSEYEKGIFRIIDEDLSLLFDFLEGRCEKKSMQTLSSLSHTPLINAVAKSQLPSLAIVDSDPPNPFGGALKLKNQKFSDRFGFSSSLVSSRSLSRLPSVAEESLGEGLDSNAAQSDSISI